MKTFRSNHRFLGVGLGILALGGIGCGAPQPKAPLPQTAPSTLSPLGPSYVLLPLPTEDPMLLGRIIRRPPAPGQSLEEVSSPNPCGDSLAAERQTPLDNTFEDAQDLRANAKATAALAGYGFQADATKATHFVYRLQTRRQSSKADTVEYEACCREKGCGIGYIASLVYGDGEYATAEESAGGGRVDVAFAAAEGDVQLRVIHRRKVHGYFAALVRMGGDSTAGPIGPLGEGTLVTGVQEATIPEVVRTIYESGKARVSTEGGLGARGTFVIMMGATAVTENEFVRRYREVTGSDELDPIERFRHAGGFYASLGAFGLGTSAAIWGFTHGKKEVTCPAPKEGACVGEPSGKRVEVNNDLGMAAAIGGGVVGGMGAILAGTLYSVSDSTPDDHYLSELQARVYVEKYNRALLRKSLHDIRQVHTDVSTRELRIPSRGRGTFAPIVSPGGLGVEGRF